MGHFNTVYLNDKQFVSVNVTAKGQTTRQEEIIRSISNELRPSVSLLKSNILFLKKHCLDNQNFLVEESFLLCEESIDNIFRFINSVQFLNDTQQGKLKLEKKGFDLDGFFHRVILEELRQLNCDVSRIHPVMAIPGIHITTDKYLLNRILVNLLTNALKFSRSIVQLFVSVIHHQLIIVVRDEGIGIPAHEIKEVFNPFTRASNVKMINGTGLGLSIVSKAVACLEGAVYVNSTINKGSEFIVVIPMDPFFEMKVTVEKPIGQMAQY